MKKQRFWIGVLLLGIFLFVFPILSGLYHMCIESRALLDWVMLYSYIYWPTYLVGLIAIPLAIYHLLRHRI